MKGTQTSFDGINLVETKHDDVDLSGMIIDNSVLRIEVLPNLTPDNELDEFYHAL